MNNNNLMEKLLKDYRMNKARICFLEKQLARIMEESQESIGEFALPASENQQATAQFNIIKESEGVYQNDTKGDKCDRITKSEAEINSLKHIISVIDDALHMVEGIDSKYRIVLERYYIMNERMEDIAEEIHLSRSRCYELCKQAVAMMSRIAYGENLLLPIGVNASDNIKQAAL